MHKGTGSQICDDMVQHKFVLPLEFSGPLSSAGLTRNIMQVLELDSRNVKALYRRAQAYINLADLDLAEFDIKKALEIDPDNRYVP